MKKSLYLVTTFGLGKYYVVTDNTTMAENMVIDSLKKANYGLPDGRKIKSITLLAEEGVLAKNSFNIGPEGLMLEPKADKPSFRMDGSGNLYATGAFYSGGNT